MRLQWTQRTKVVLILCAVLLGGLTSLVLIRAVTSDGPALPFLPSEPQLPDLTTIDGPVDILVLGSDSRDRNAPVEGASRWRADTIMLVHIPASHDEAFIVNFPRDLWVEVPGRGMAKINAAYAWGGRALMVQTVENYTGVDVDHTAVIDFAGTRKLVDALGGVNMHIEKTIKSIHPPYRTFKEGDQHLNGAEALDYIRQRYQYNDGDYTRMIHQQAFVQAVLTKAASVGVLDKLIHAQQFIDGLGDAVVWNKGAHPLDMMWQFRGLRQENLTFVITPNTGTAIVAGQSVIRSDRAKAGALFDAIAKDDMIKVGEVTTAE